MTTETTTTEPDTGETTETTTTEPATTETETTDTAAELEKWKAQSRKHEERAKANAAAAKELERLKVANMDETEKAVAEARQQGELDATRKLGSRLVAAEVKAAAAGRAVDVDALLEAVDTSRFLDDEGEPDTDAIVAWLDKVAPVAEQQETQPTPAGFPDLGQGSRQTIPLNGDPLLNTLKSKLGIA